MSDKPEALRLADALEHGKYLLSVERDATAAELRRLHDVVYTYKWQVRDTCARAEKAETERDALLAKSNASRACVVVTQKENARPENFDAELGCKIARVRAVEKLWPLLGFALRERLHRGGE